jgi:hypothetical protein
MKAEYIRDEPLCLFCSAPLRCRRINVAAIKCNTVRMTQV